MTRKPKRDPEAALHVKLRCEEIWKDHPLNSPFLKAQWNTTKYAGGNVWRRENKEKIREYTREE